MQLCTAIINRTWHRSFTHEWHESKQSAGENKVTFHRISRSLTNTVYQFACSVFSAFSFRSLPPPHLQPGPPRASAPARRRALTGGFLAQGIATAGVPAICQAFRHFRYITRTSPPCPLPLFLPLPHLTCIPRAGHGSCTHFPF